MESFQPPPLYPPLISRPLSLDQSEQYNNILSIKKNIREETITCYLIENKTSTIERYSDKYSKLKKADANKWQPNWNILPKELKYYFEKDDKKIRKRKAETTPNLVKRKVKKDKSLDLGKLVEKIGTAEDENENEEADDEEKKEKKSEKGSDEEENADELENQEDEEAEEENDYIDSYFDNGENYDDDDLGCGGDDEGPVY